jgi:uncharacterized protein
MAASRQRSPRLRRPVRSSFLKVLTGSALSTRRLALIETQGREPGPVVWLTACVHGDEVGGIVVVQEVLRKLRRAPLLRGSLHAFPLLNPIGFENASRTMGPIREDLNRSFPGNPNGTPAARIAHLVFSRILRSEPNLVLDLHNDWIRSIPYTLIDPPGKAHLRTYERAKGLAAHTGSLLVDEQEEGATEQLERTLTGCLMLHDVPALTLELGEAHVVNEDLVRIGVEAVLSVLAALEMIDPASVERHYVAPGPFAGQLLQYSHQPLCSTSGIVRFVVRPGETVEPGQPVARIYNVFGKLQETLRAEKTGVVLGHADSSVAVPGVPLVAFGNVRTRSGVRETPPKPTRRSNA